MTEHRPDGLSALFATRQDAELAIEHLVQQHGLERAAIFAEPVGDAGTAGIAASGGDHGRGASGDEARDDAPLNGEIRLSVPVTQETRSLVHAALSEANGRAIADI